MEFIENRDYRLDHERKLIYIPTRLKSECYRHNSAAQRLTWIWAQKGYHVHHDCSDEFIRTGKHPTPNNPF